MAPPPSGRRRHVIHDVMFYADDTSLYRTHNKDNIDTAQRSLQHDLDSIRDYGRKWAITFNASKTIQQTFTRRPDSPIPTLKFDDEIITIKTSHKHLGVIFSNDLKFHEHINDIVRKVNIALSPLYPIAKYIPRSVLTQIYVTYIRPYFDYCDILYDGHITKDDELRLERLQTRAARLVTGTPFRTPSDKLRRELGWDSLKTRRKIHKLLFYRKLLDNRHSLPDYLTLTLTQTRGAVTQRRLRNTDTMTLPPNRTTSFQRSFIPDTTRLWNRLPQFIRASSSPATFKKTLTKHTGVTAPPTYYSIGNKTGNTLHTQLRTGTLPLNAFLFQTQKTEAPHCPCGFRQEDTTHFILHCPLYERLRGELFTTTSHITNTDFRNKQPLIKLQTLLHGHNLNNTERHHIAKHFQTFISKAIHTRQVTVAVAAAVGTGAADG